MTETDQWRNATIQRSAQTWLRLLRESGASLGTLLHEIEEALIAEAMRATAGNCGQAARDLGMNRTTLVQKRQRYGLPMGMSPRSKR